MVKRHIDSFERFIRRTVEGSLRQVFRQEITSQELLGEVHQHVYDHLQSGKSLGQVTVQVTPAVSERLSVESGDLETFLQSGLRESLVKSGVAQTMVPSLVVELVESSATQGILLRDEEKQEKTDTTQVMNISEAIEAELAPLRALDAFLIIGGRSHFSRDKPTITIGRHLSNDIVLGSSRISRRHAQLRWRFGRFVLYDLGSRAGIFVNEQRIKETVLSPGDVIQLAEVILIYGEEENQVVQPAKVMNEEPTANFPTRELKPPDNV